jgi:hypothetical protein
MVDSHPVNGDRDPRDQHPDDGARDTGPTGRMRFQDENTTPREATLAERKARERAQRREQEAQLQAEAEQERSRTKRKRIMIGAGVTVGVVALIAVGYAVAQPEEEVQASCVGDDGVIVDDANCVTPATGSNSTYYGGGGFYPIFIGAGGRQYHYNYGGAGSLGGRVTGGTTTVPREGTRVRTTSGRSPAGSASSGGSVSSGKGGSVSSGSSGSVSRGGLGSSGGGSSSGG